jgi:hypothetical protein
VRTTGRDHKPISFVEVSDLGLDTPPAHHLRALLWSLPRPDRRPEHFLRPAPPRLPRHYLPLAIPLRSPNQQLGGWLILVNPPTVRPDVLAVPRRGAGDLQGLSNRPTANSESVEELVEEGNALEAEAVQGVENALDADQGEVRTKEVPEDDVPEEYLDKDR